MRNQPFIKGSVLTLTAFLLAGCSSGDVSFLSDPNDDGSRAADVASLTLLASAPQLASNASDVSNGVTLTAIAKDANNNVVPGVTVTFSTSDSAEINVSNPAVTDQNGRAIAVLTTGGDPQNRTITVAAFAGDAQKSVIVKVVGSTLAISGPLNTQINVQTAYTINLNDAAGNGVSGQAVSVTTNAGNTLSAASLTTDTSGQAVVQLTATNPNTTVTVSALGLTSTVNVTVSTDEFSFTAPATDTEILIGSSETLTVQWLRDNSPVPDGTVINFSATRGTLSADSATTSGGIATVNLSSAQAGFSIITANSTALSEPSVSTSVEFVATTPAAIEVQASPAVISITQSSEIVATVRDANSNLVKNQTVDYTLSDASGGNLSSPTAVTNSQGQAKIQYNATTQSSASEGVRVTGTVRGTSFSDSALLTVGAIAARITIGTGTEIIVKDESTYQLPYTVVVTDSAGNPVPDADFTLSLQPYSFLKGTRGFFGPECLNEDLDFNDQLDPSIDSDADNDGKLEPGRVASVPRTIVLDPEDGAGQFTITYAKEYGEFVYVRLIAVATVSGTQATESRIVALPIAQGDATNLPQESPYGVVASCADPN